MTDLSEGQTTEDLLSLAAAAQGKVVSRVTITPADEARQSRIANLKAKYQAGELNVDEKALVSKLVDTLFESLPPAVPGAPAPNDKT